MEGDLVQIDIDGEIMALRYADIQRAKLILNDELLALAGADGAKH